MQNPIQIPLNLPDVSVIEVKALEPRGWLIRVESTQSGTACRQCGRRIEEFHGYDKVLRLQHLPLFEVPVWLELRPKRYRCRDCEGGPTTTQQLSWYQARSPYTKAYEQWLLKLLINSTISDVSQKLDVSEACITGVLERWIESSVNWEAFESIGVMGIDEISLKRGHRDFVAIVTRQTPQGVDILGVLSDRKQATVEGFNNRIKVLKRRCYGIFDVKRIFQRLTLDLHGYQRFAATKAIISS